MTDTNTKSPPPPRHRRERARASVFSQGEPLVWLTGGGLVTAVVMIVALLLLVLVQGLTPLWPAALESFETHAGTRHMGEVTRVERFRPPATLIDSLGGPAREAARAELAAGDGLLRRQLLRIGNYELTGEHFLWLPDYEVSQRGAPSWSLVIERLAWGRFYGTPLAFLIDGEPAAAEPAAIWALYQEHHGPVRKRSRVRRHLETIDLGKINHDLEKARLAIREAELETGAHSPLVVERQADYRIAEKIATAKFEEVRKRIDALDAENARYALQLTTADGQEKRLPLADIVRAHAPNRLGVAGKLAVYLSRWGEFLGGEPREANSEGGVYPAIFGTVVMTLLMSIAVVPFGVMAALFLREYAKAGPLISIVRISINNLAGVPSIVFGVFGLGFFCYFVGVSIDELLFAAKLPNPTYGKGGVLWASLTLALLTLPVVIVATEEALAAVPGSMREGSYACGASRWQTIRRIVLPRALPGIMTGTILAMARGAGEVAPLMLVGAVKLAPELPLDTVAPFVHAERSFMHLGFHIYDLGFQSQNSEAAKPMVYTTTLLLIAIIFLLNVVAVRLRTRLRRKFVSSAF